jgi:hypothetical protein
MGAREISGVVLRIVGICLAVFGGLMAVASL